MREKLVKMTNNINIRHAIQKAGSVDVAQFMEFVLSGKEHGYYTNKDPIGRNGDFITAPEISQLFGEMIGLKLAQFWLQSGQPKDCILVELGPGKGTLMNDLLRATKNVPGFHQAMTVYMLEISNPLLQEQKLIANQNSEVKFNWISSLNELPNQPIYLVANEFFDALPINQYVKNRHEWYEVLVTLSPENGEYKFIEALLEAKRDQLLNEEYPGAKHRSYVEVSTQSIEIIKDISTRIAKSTGIGIVIDYGYCINNLVRSDFNSTLQSVIAHKYNPVLSYVGQADITAHVDFFALRAAAMARGVEVDEIITQGEFLLNMGIKLRAEILKKNAANDVKKTIDLAVARLISPHQMGELFKVMLVTKSQNN